MMLRPALGIGTANCTNGLREGIVEAGIPVDNDDDVHDQVGDAKGIGVVCPGLCPLEKLQHPETNIMLTRYVLRRRIVGNCEWVAYLLKRSNLLRRISGYLMPRTT